VQFCFGDYALDVERRELKCGAALVSVEPQVFDLLVYLMRNRNRVVSKNDVIAAVWGGRIVSKSTLTTRINAARKAVGDSGDRQAVIRTIARKGFRFVGAVSEGEALDASARTSADGAAPEAPRLHQEIRYCTTRSGVRIAYAACGEGPPLVKTATWLSHLEFEWESPLWRHWLDGLSARNRLIRYDERGNGLSDWQIDEVSFELMVQDLEDVVDAAGLDRFALIGISQGCAVSAAYAVRHPERVSRLILYGGFVKGWRAGGEAEILAKWSALGTLMREGWGQNNPAFRQLFTSLFVPGATQQQMDWFNDMQRKSVSPANAERLNEAIGDFDVVGLLPQVTTPTLVLHAREDAVVRIESGRWFAKLIPDARFVSLESKNHIMLAHEPAFARFLEEVQRFLAE
jgi:pimeloyl-ACP methyl ester carboxylesterase/DNA-binding winged helix-turn-helix (wHTH) protein